MANNPPNPYSTLLKTHPTSQELRTAYETHRTLRAATQRTLLLSPTSHAHEAITPDPILRRLVEDEGGVEHGTSDTRCNLVFWARPPERVRGLVGRLQRGLGEVVGPMHLHPTPLPHLHLTVLEIASAHPTAEIDAIVTKIEPALPRILDHAPDIARDRECKARLGRPMITFDGQGVALSFLPMPAQPVAGSSRVEGQVAQASHADIMEGRNGTEKADQGRERVQATKAEGFTYHHLRAELYDLASRHVPINARYVAPSAHVTVARWIRRPADGADDGRDGRDDGERVRRVVKRIEELNLWLEEEYWGDDGEESDKEESGGSWIVGEEVGLHLRAGACWYGGGGWCVGSGRVVDGDGDDGVEM